MSALLTHSEIEAILYLLDDTDEGVVNQIESRLYQEGSQIIPILENYWEGNKNPLRSYRIENIIKNIQEKELADGFKSWLAKPEKSLLEANFLISRIQYPGMNEVAINQYLEKLKLDVWMALYSAQNPVDKVQILNHILFDRHGLHGNTENYHAPDNSFLSRAIESRQANPITLCNLYSIVAQRLGIPIFGVNLPQHFVLAYCEGEDLDKETPLSFSGELNRKDFGKVLFYINPFSKGQVFLKNNIDDFLKLIQVEPQADFYEPCDNREILKRMLRNVHFAYGEVKNEEKVNQVVKYMQIMGMLSDMDTDEDALH